MVKEKDVGEMSLNKLLYFLINLFKLQPAYTL